MLYRLVIASLPRTKHLLISWLQSPSEVILKPKKIKSVTVSIVSPSICHEVMGLDAKNLVFWTLSFKPTFSLLFHFHQEALQFLFTLCIRVVSFAYLRLLILLSAILIQVCAWSSNSTPGYMSEANKNTNSKKYTHHNIYSSIIYNSQDMEAT